jgi:hypothetical protein
VRPDRSARRETHAGGTPSDPFDDEFLADLGVVKGSTGRSEDLCEAAVPALS